MKRLLSILAASVIALSSTAHANLFQCTATETSAPLNTGSLSDLNPWSKSDLATGVDFSFDTSSGLLRVHRREAGHSQPIRFEILQAASQQNDLIAIARRPCLVACPDVQTAMSLAGIGVEMQVGAVNARRQSGLMAGEDAAFYIIYTALNEAGVHVHYLFSVYQILPQIARGSGRDALSTAIIPAAARDIGSSLALADQVLPRVRSPEARAMLQRGVEVRRALGREFERC